MRRAEVDGVPVFWQQGPAPLSAGLCFGVGRRDESFATGGTTHLVEHLVMGALPKSHLDRNACVTPKVTEFTATGRPELVAGFLERVCALLSDLPTDRLATEAKVLAAEEERGGSDVVGVLLTLRYGATGLGLLGMVEPALASLTAEQVRGHAARWFVRENAALWLTGPVPDGLRLPLPSGDVPARPRQHRLPLALPAQTGYPGPDPAMSFEAPADDVVLCALRILADRLTERLRYVGGHSYDVDFAPLAIDGETAHIAFYADAPETERRHVLEGMWEELHRLVEHGPTPEELAHDVEGVREHTADPRAVEGLVVAAVSHHFDGRPDLDDDETLRLLERVTPQEVGAALRPALDTALLLVPDETPRVLPRLPVLPEGSTERLVGRELKRRFRSDAPRGSRLVLSDDGVTLLIGPNIVTVRFDTCVAVGVGEGDHGHLELVGVDGFTVPVCEQDWREGARLVEQVLAAVDGLPRYPVRPEAPDRSRGSV